MTENITETSIDENAKILWDYLDVQRDFQSADFILVLGSHDLRVANHAAALYQQGVAPWFIASGGYGKITKDLWKVPEAVRFAEIASAAGVPESRILTETRAANTGDNFVFVRELLAKDGRVPQHTGVIVTKPYMKRRAYATACKQWPEIEWGVSAPNLSYEVYPDAEVSKPRMINLMVGDLQRMKVYAEQGFQIPQDIPSHVWAAYETLVKAGFDQFVMK